MLDSKEIHLVFRVRKLNDAIKRLDVEAKVTYLTIKCCIPFLKCMHGKLVDELPLY
jgi:hypothetical protein